MITELQKLWIFYYILTYYSSVLVRSLDYYRPGVKRNFWIVKFLTSRHVRMHRAIFYISNTLRKLMI